MTTIAAFIRKTSAPSLRAYFDQVGIELPPAVNWNGPEAEIAGPLLKAVDEMSDGELFALMSCGMAGVAGTVMIIYSQFIGALIPNALGNILIASVISTPAALALAALMVPSGSPTDTSETGLTMESPPQGAVDALLKGTTAGIPVLIGIVATLVVSIAIIALINHALALLPAVSNSPITLQRIFSYMFMPVLWLMGIPGQELNAAAHLMATKTVLNEFVAYQTFATLPADRAGPGNLYSTLSGVSV